MTGIRKWPFRLKETVWAGERIDRLWGGNHIGEAYLFADSEEFLRQQGIFVAQGGAPLIKYIDVGSPLSVQVHPGGDRGKDELWIVDEVREDAAVYIGFLHNTSDEMILDSCDRGTILSLMRRYPVEKGNIFWIPGGTIHCAEGFSFFEVQNERDVTYRLYDHGRNRNLQQREALSVLDKKAVLPFLVRKTEQEIGELLPFQCVLCRDENDIFENAATPCIYTMLSEKASFCGAEISLGTSFFVPENTFVYGKGAYLKIEWKSLCEKGEIQRITL
ncbi:MAG: class I mannose-6-phosphate isomerase [Firmicutes bacterium]|nr:class I mannose-6-phosphate isomerase [Bacillota bacterium]